MPETSIIDKVSRLFQPRTSGVDNEMTNDARIRVSKFRKFYEEPDAMSPIGYFKGRRIIGSNTPINNGVYVGVGKREAIVVDDQKDLYLNSVYKELLNKTARARMNKTFDADFLNDVFEIAKKRIPYDLNTTKNYVSKLPSDQKVFLGNFIEGGFGICRHQALLAGYLVERLIKEGKITGKVCVERNYVKGLGAHAWAKYTDLDGNISIIDTAQEVAGRLKDVLTPENWPYQELKDKRSSARRPFLRHKAATVLK